MSLGLITKGGMVLVGGTGVATGGYFIYSHASSKSEKLETFRNRIESSGKSLIDNNDLQWDAKVAIYGKEDNGHKIRINGEEKAVISKIELKAWCSENLKLSYSQEKDSLAALINRWCVVPTIKEALSKEAKRLIPTDGNLDGGWNQKIQAKSDQIVTDLINKLHLTNTGGTTVSPETLREWCKGNIEKEYISETGNNYEFSKDWCLQV